MAPRLITADIGWAYSVQALCKATEVKYLKNLTALGCCYYPCFTTEETEARGNLCIPYPAAKGRGRIPAQVMWPQHLSSFITELCCCRHLIFNHVTLLSGAGQGWAAQLHRWGKGASRALPMSVSVPEPGCRWNSWFRAPGLSRTLGSALHSWQSHHL